MNLLHTLPVIEGLHKIADGHIEVLPVLLRDGGLGVDVVFGPGDLLLYDHVVMRHHQHIMDVVNLPVYSSTSAESLR